MLDTTRSPSIESLRAGIQQSIPDSKNRNQEKSAVEISPGLEPGEIPVGKSTGSSGGSDWMGWLYWLCDGGAPYWEVGTEVYWSLFGGEVIEYSLSPQDREDCYRDLRFRGEVERGDRAFKTIPRLLGGVCSVAPEGLVDVTIAFHPEESLLSACTLHPNPNPNPEPNPEPNPNPNPRNHSSLPVLSLES